jgi:hypothetical protein
MWTHDGIKRAVPDKDHPTYYEWQYTGKLICSCRGSVRKIEAQEGEIVMEQEHDDGNFKNRKTACESL